MKLKELFEQSQKLYHVTLTKNVDKIKSKGILPLQTSNWVQAGSKERYGDGSIFAFENVADAIRWAARWDWDLNKDMGTGKVSIITFDGSKDDWDVDTADPIGQAGSKGKWLKRRGAVKPSLIKSSTPLTKDMVKQGVLSEEERKIYGKKYTPEEIKALPEFSRSVAEKAYKISKGDKVVVIDNERGIGQVPLNQEVLYSGFAGKMKISTFLELALDDKGEQDKTADWLIDRMKEGYALGNPWFHVTVSDDKDAPLQISGHEGRGRTKAIKKFLGSDVEIPVHFILTKGMKNRDLTPEILKKAEDGWVLPQQWDGHKMTDPSVTKLFVIGKDKIKDVIK